MWVWLIGTSKQDPLLTAEQVSHGALNNHSSFWSLRSSSATPPCGQKWIIMRPAWETVQVLSVLYSEWRGSWKEESTGSKDLHHRCLWKVDFGGWSATEQDEDMSLCISNIIYTGTWPQPIKTGALTKLPRSSSGLFSCLPSSVCCNRSVGWLRNLQVFECLVLSSWRWYSLAGESTLGAGPEEIHHQGCGWRNYVIRGGLWNFSSWANLWN